MSNNKMKGLLKGLRYISQIFDNEKEPEMEIGFPTDVKHVAHIGWDGPSVNSPSWMNEFKAPTGFASAPLNHNGEIKDDASVKWVSQDSSRRGSGATNSPTRDMPELPKSSRRQASTLGNSGTGGNIMESPTREKTEKAKPRKSSKSKDSSDSTRSSRRNSDSNLDGESPTINLPGVPKKTRRKKSKDSSVEGSVKSRSKAVTTESYQSPFSDPGSDTGSTVSKNDQRLFGEDGFFT